MFAPGRGRARQSQRGTEEDTEEEAEEEREEETEKETDRGVGNGRQRRRQRKVLARLGGGQMFSVLLILHRYTFAVGVYFKLFMH